MKDQVKETLHNLLKTLECPICLEVFDDPVSTSCHHQFCRKCINTVITSNNVKNKSSCPLCKAKISKRGLKEKPYLNEILSATKEITEAIKLDTGLDVSPPKWSMSKARDDDSPSFSGSNKAIPLNESASSTGSLKRSNNDQQPFKNKRFKSSTVVYDDGNDLNNSNVTLISNINVSYGFPAPLRKKLGKDDEKIVLLNIPEHNKVLGKENFAQSNSPTKFRLDFLPKEASTSRKIETTSSFVKNLINTPSRNSENFDKLAKNNAENETMINSVKNYGRKKKSISKNAQVVSLANSPLEVEEMDSAEKVSQWLSTQPNENTFVDDASFSTFDSSSVSSIPNKIFKTRNIMYQETQPRERVKNPPENDPYLFVGSQKTPPLKLTNKKGSRRRKPQELGKPKVSKKAVKAKASTSRTKSNGATLDDFDFVTRNHKPTLQKPVAVQSSTFPKTSMPPPAAPAAVPSEKVLSKPKSLDDADDELDDIILFQTPAYDIAEYANLNGDYVESDHENDSEFGVTKNRSKVGKKGNLTVKRSRKSKEKASFPSTQEQIDNLNEKIAEAEKFKLNIEYNDENKKSFVTPDQTLKLAQTEVVFSSPNKLTKSPTKEAANLVLSPRKPLGQANRLNDGDTYVSASNTPKKSVVSTPELRRCLDAVVNVTKLVPFGISPLNINEDIERLIETLPRDNKRGGAKPVPPPLLSRNIGAVSTCPTQGSQADRVEDSLGPRPIISESTPPPNVSKNQCPVTPVSLENNQRLTENTDKQSPKLTSSQVEEKSPTVKCPDIATESSDKSPKILVKSAIESNENDNQSTFTNDIVKQSNCFSTPTEIQSIESVPIDSLASSNNPTITPLSDIGVLKLSSSSSDFLVNQEHCAQLLEELKSEANIINRYQNNEISTADICVVSTDQSSCDSPVATKSSVKDSPKETPMSGSKEKYACSHKETSASTEEHGCSSKETTPEEKLHEIICHEKLEEFEACSGEDDESVQVTMSVPKKYLLNYTRDNQETPSTAEVRVTSNTDNEKFKFNFKTEFEIKFDAESKTFKLTSKHFSLENQIQNSPCLLNTSKTYNDVEVQTDVSTSPCSSASVISIGTLTDECYPFKSPPSLSDISIQTDSTDKLLVDFEGQTDMTPLNSPSSATEIGIQTELTMSNLKSMLLDNLGKPDRSIEAIRRETRSGIEELDPWFDCSMPDNPPQISIISSSLSNDSIVHASKPKLEEIPSSSIKNQIKEDPRRLKSSMESKVPSQNLEGFSQSSPFTDENQNQPPVKTSQIEAIAPNIPSVEKIPDDILARFFSQVAPFNDTEDTEIDDNDFNLDQDDAAKSNYDPNDTKLEDDFLLDNNSFDIDCENLDIFDEKKQSPSKAEHVTAQSPVSNTSRQESPKMVSVELLPETEDLLKRVENPLEITVDKRCKDDCESVIANTSFGRVSSPSPVKAPDSPVLGVSERKKSSKLSRRKNKTSPKSITPPTTINLVENIEVVEPKEVIPKIETLPKSKPSPASSICSNDSANVSVSQVQVPKSTIPKTEPKLGLTTEKTKFIDDLSELSKSKPPSPAASKYNNDSTNVSVSQLLAPKSTTQKTEPKLGLTSKKTKFIDDFADLSSDDSSFEPVITSPQDDYDPNEETDSLPDTNDRLEKLLKNNYTDNGDDANMKAAESTVAPLQSSLMKLSVVKKREINLMKKRKAVDYFKEPNRWRSSASSSVSSSPKKKPTFKKLNISVSSNSSGNIVPTKKFKRNRVIFDSDSDEEPEIPVVVLTSTTDSEMDTPKTAMRKVMANIQADLDLEVPEEEVTSQTQPEDTDKPGNVTLPMTCNDSKSTDCDMENEVVEIELLRQKIEEMKRKLPKEEKDDTSKTEAKINCSPMKDDSGSDDEGNESDNIFDSPIPPTPPRPPKQKKIVSNSK